jgi:hypothetical protein
MLSPIATTDAGLSPRYRQGWNTPTGVSEPEAAGARPPRLLDRVPAALRARHGQVVLGRGPAGARSPADRMFGR